MGPAHSRSSNWLALSTKRPRDHENRRDLRPSYGDRRPVQTPRRTAGEKDVSPEKTVANRIDQVQLTTHAKAKVESAVQVVQRWIVMRLRHRRFFSVAQINEAIGELLVYVNNRPFRKRKDENRASLFAKIDRPALHPLPVRRYDLSQWAQARVNIDYHVAFDGNWYSVPYTLTGEAVEVRSTPATVEIFHRGKRVASHLRSRERNRSVCHNEHRPKSHQAHLEWPPSRMIDWAAQVGSHTAQLVARILESKPHPEMGYRACLGIIRLAAKYSPERMEHAAERALLTGAVSCPRIQSILRNGLDSQPPTPVTPARLSPEHENLRGPQYFQ